MSTATYLTFLLILAAAALAKGGANLGTLLIFLAATVLCAIPWYFGTRDRAKPPSLVERLFATAWVWFRRFLCFTVGGLCFVGAAFMATSPQAAKDFSRPGLTALAIALFGAAICYLGVFGQGKNQYDLRDDIRLHKENKRRYRWWF